MASVSLLRGWLPFVALCFCVANGGSIGNGFLDSSRDRQDYNWIAVEEPEMTMKACQLVEARGYECEEHEVETKDGYILTIHRIPIEKKTKCLKKDRVLLLHHGFLGSSTDYLINSPNQSLSYLFSDACYDVWIANARGNRYGLKHNTYTSDDEEFWKFSFDEMAEYDMPAIIDYILHKTNQKALFYIGHSQATIVGFEAFSENKELAKKIRFFGAMSPVGYVKNTKTQGNIYGSMNDETIYFLFGRKSFLGQDWRREFVIKSVCSHSATRGVCVRFVETLGGKFSPFFNASRIAIYFLQSPAGSSVQNLVHWAQSIFRRNYMLAEQIIGSLSDKDMLMRTTRSTKYMYSSHLENVAKYGSWNPPEIKFSQMNVPTAVFSGGEDTITDEKDLNRLVSELPNVVAKVRISDYSHLDFIYATNAAETIFKPLSILMKNY